MLKSRGRTVDVSCEKEGNGGMTTSQVNSNTLMHRLMQSSTIKEFITRRKGGDAHRAESKETYCSA